MRIFLDSDVIIAALDGNELQSSDAQRVMDLVEAGSVQAVTTPVVLANVMHVVSQKWRISRTRVDRPRVVGDC
jgi:predicted nucleic acid-binding protein